MYTLNITKAIKKISVNDIIDFIYENYYKQIGFSKEDCYRSLKRLKKEDLLLFANILIVANILIIILKVSYPQHYESFLRKKNRKSVKQLEIITYQPKTLQNPSIIINQLLQNIQKLHTIYHTAHYKKG